MHPEVHALQNVPAAVVDDAADLGGVEGAGEVRVHVVVVVQAAAAMQREKSLPVILESGLISNY